ncbi:hypothetical protein BC940DRAFT_299058 [Gongronella butleri]|nr:hypothetical protein BC940DRAFT_299058 [Gongronella butleri]
MKAPHQEMVEAFATRLHDLQDQVARDTSKQLDQQLTTLQQAMQASHAQLQAENNADPSKEASLKEDVSRFAHDWLEQQFASGLLVDRAGVQAAVLQMMQQQQQQQPLEGDWQQKVRQWVQDALYKYHNDGTDADYALHSRGARIMDEWTSPTHNLGKGMRMRAWYWLAGHLVDPTTAIRPATHVGHCWPMEGSNGAIGIRLAQPIAIESISIDHPAAAHLPSSPRDLEVWGVRKAKGNDMHNLYGYNNKKNDHALLNNLQNNPNMLFLGNISHDPKLAIQNHDIAPRYTLPNPTKTAMDGIVLRVINNHGHNDYTCLYRVRVHGNP